MRSKIYAFLLLVTVLFFVSLAKLLLFFSFFTSKKKPNSIAFFAAFIPENAGYKWRVKKWSEVFEQEGLQVKIYQAIKPSEFVYKHDADHFVFLIRFLRRRFFQVLKSRHFETVIVRRELLPFNDYGNLFLDKLLLKFHPNAILDFDDDIAAIKNEPRTITNFYARLLVENGSKFTETLRLYKRHVVASQFLKNKVLETNKTIQANAVLVIPTCVDFTEHPPKNYSQLPETLTFGWIGGDHNYPQLETIFPVLNALSKRYSFKLLIVAGSSLAWNTDFPIEFVPWSLKTEKESILRMDVGLMPLVNSDVSKGKGGFKLIQYMGLGVVSVASAITINKEIISDKKNSYLAENMDDWTEILDQILKKEIDFVKIGQSARNTILQSYSFSGNQNKYIQFIANQQ